MEKRFHVALLLSFLVYLWWSITNAPPAKTEQANSEAPIVEVESPLEGYVDGDESNLTGAIGASEEEFFDLRLGDLGAPGSYEMRFTNRGASLLSLRMGDYFSEQDLLDRAQAEAIEWVPLIQDVRTPDGPAHSLVISASESAKAWLREPLETALWESRLLEDGSGIEFTYAPGTGLVFRKRLERAPGTYQLRFTFEVENVGAPEARGLKQFSFTPAGAVPATKDTSAFYQEPQTLAVWSMDDGEIEVETAVMKEGTKDPAGPLPGPNGSRLEFAGVHNKFFAFLVSPPSRKEAAMVIGTTYRRVTDLDWLDANPEEDAEDARRLVICDMAMQVPVPDVGGTVEVVFDLFAGPKQRQTMAAANEVYPELLDEDIGMFSGIANIITSILGFYQGLVGNWGWAIILMTLTVRLVLFPLNRRAQTAMARFSKKMKRVQPLLDANKEKYADDPKRQREEQAKIMQKEGAFPPLGGCAPMFLQFPVFIGLFQALRVHFDLRHEPFILWMKDLSAPDQLARIDVDVFGFMTIEYLNILPLLMIVLWIGQHKAMPQPETNDPKQAQTRKIMIGMQVFFAFLFYNYASGLALYMITSSAVAIFESLVIKRMWPIDDTELEKKKKKPGRFMQKMAELQKEQQRRLEEEQKRRNSQKGGKKGKKGKRK